MSFSPSPYLVKLQDLKLWQCNYDSLLKTKTDAAHPSDFETIEGLSDLDSPDPTPHASPRRASLDWDKKALTPARPFEQLLDEKLAEEQPVNVQVRAKKPFLRKGSGLLRYNLAPRTGRRAKRAASEEKTRQDVPAKPDEVTQQSLTPLKVPDFSIRSKTAWVKAGEEETPENSVDMESKDGQNSTGFHSNIIGRINEFALNHFLPVSPKKYAKGSSDSVKDSDSLNTTEKELQIFEALEERVENTSFSSTNSSIMRLLSSTPNKKVIPKKSPILEENPRDCNFFENRRLAQKLKEVNEKSDVLSDFLLNLRKLSKDQFVGDSAKQNREITPDTSCSEGEEEKSSTNTDTGTISASSLYTDYETTFKETTKADAAVNTSDTEEQQKENSDCPDCKELRASLKALKKEVPDIQAEKARVCDFAKELEKKRDQLSRENEKLRKKYEKDVGELREELDSEKRKFVREKSIFDMYTKEAHNRPTKKERDEIAGLKKELADLKELSKLKDAKNGATQARLRNQIKQLERERGELRAAADGLRQENSKLSAAQRARRPAEAKMLHEISRNVTKLTEESLRGRSNGSAEAGGDRDEARTTGRRRRSTGDAGRKPDKEISSPKLNRKPLPNFKRRLSEDRESVIECPNEVDPVRDSSLEKQYETTFRQANEGLAQISMNESKEGTKTTKVFPDGSKEIKYSNGSWKTVSPDGRLILFKYYNGDVKETDLKGGTVKYYFAESSTWNTEFPDGSELVEYANGQRERKFKDGKIEVRCPDGRLLTRLPDGSDEIAYPDGSRLLQNADGDKTIVFPNGQKEVHTKEHKRREYPDGTVKFIYPDGTRETRYSSGRIRIKDSNNVLVMDSHAG